MDSNDLNFIHEQLHEDEQLLWSAKPNPNKLFSKGDVYLIPFSMLWTGFVVYGFITSIAEAFLVLKIMLSFFLIVGLYYTIGRFLYKRSKRKRTLYALTDKRVLELVKGSHITIKALYYSQICGWNISVRKDASGTLMFGESGGLSDFFADSGLDIFGTPQNNKPVFYGVENVKIPAGILEDKLHRNVTER